jgi:hypothetical protein
MIKGIVVGVIGAIAVGLAAFYLVAVAGGIPSNADAKQDREAGMKRI